MIKKPIILVFLLAFISAFLFTSFSLHAQTPLFKYSSKDGPKEYYIKTSDNWTLSLHRYMPAGLDKNKAPVILCHGFNYNSSFWDLDKDHSFARYLQEKGHDVWAVNLRGSGDSSKPAISDLKSLTRDGLEKVPQVLLRAPLNIGKFDWTIDDHINKDVPAIIDFVKNETAKSKVIWIGHSMGGMILYPYLERGDADNIKAFVAIASMANVKQPPSKALALIASQKPIADASFLINTTVAHQVKDLTFGAIKLPWEELYYNENNTNKVTAEKMFRVTMDDTSPGVIKQYSNMIISGEFMSVDKKEDYTKKLHLIRVPMLIIAGRGDEMATVETMQYLYDNISSKDKELHVFSKKNGYSADYGHCDLILGKNSKEEVYNYIYNWLKKR